MSQQFQNKIALVTGAASGIGLATAKAFAGEGAFVVISDVQVAQGEACVREIKRLGGQAEFMTCDVSKVSEIASMIDRIISDYGRLDLAFNNAGVEGAVGFTAVSTEENWDRVLNTNLKGIWASMKFEIECMLKQKEGGVIVNCASIAGLIGFQGLSAYVASKHGLIGLTKTAALEYATKNIRINAVCPGAVHTPMLERIAGGAKEAEARFASSEPMGRIGKPEEIADAVLWLSSSKSSFVTGHALVVDGGWVAG